MPYIASVLLKGSAGRCCLYTNLQGYVLDPN